MKHWKGDPSKPLVSICCITYNHESYIEDALEGFLIQETDFPFEILIHDDASTDKTADIICEYEFKYPNIIKPVYQIENQYSKGIKPNQNFNFPRVKGEYIAMCEGDDYWFDPSKLVKQVHLLTRNPEFSISAHPVQNFYQDASMSPHVFPALDKTKLVFDIYDLFRWNFMNSCSVVYRKVVDALPSWCSSHVIGDYPNHLFYAHYGKIAFVPEVMANYRIHSGGVWAMKGSSDKQRYLLDRLAIFDDFNRHFGMTYTKDIQRAKERVIPGLVDTFLQNNEYNKALYYLKQYFKIKYILTRTEQFKMFFLLTLTHLRIPYSLIHRPYVRLKDLQGNFKKKWPLINTYL